MRYLFAFLACFAANVLVLAGDGNRLSYLDSNEVWYPHKDFPKLITPQWVGEEGVECVVTLAIDDMRDTAKYEAYLRPILQRLKQIDGRAPVSIMTNSVKPDDPQLQTWLQEGLSLECHTADHPCPLLAGGSGVAGLVPSPPSSGERVRVRGPNGVKPSNAGDSSITPDSALSPPHPNPLPPKAGGEGTGEQPPNNTRPSTGLSKAKSTYDKCVDLMASIPNNKPVAFRTPCCDSLNTVSPRLFSEIINKTTPGGNFLQLDSSVFMLYTADDPSIPRELVTDPDGREKFRKYIPRGFNYGGVTHNRFVNTIENYPYPYVIQRLCWEFPCMVPSDWSANHLHQPNNPDTVRDLKAALDITVLKQGVFNLVFHPHGWIKSEQVIELIDHAVAKHGKKVKFLNFRECVERLNKNVLDGQSLRDEKGNDNGVRLTTVQETRSEGKFQDVVQFNSKRSMTRVWSEDAQQWESSREYFAYRFEGKLHLKKGRVLQWPPLGLFVDENSEYIETWFSTAYSPPMLLVDKSLGLNLSLQKIEPAEHLNFAGAKVVRIFDKRSDIAIVLQPRDIDTWIITHPFGSATGDFSSHRAWSPPGVRICGKNGEDVGLRFTDINEDGSVDIVYSNLDRYGIWLFESLEKGWSVELLSGKRGDKPADLELPPIVREDGSDNGFFVRDRHLCWINEDTDGLPDFILRVAFDKLLGDRLPDAKSPEAAKQSMRVAPGYRVDLVAHEPLTMDPVAFDWGPDGKLWVAEMADYPRGIPDDEPDPGARRAATAVPSPPSSGERARVRGPSGEQTPNPRTASLKTPVENGKPDSTISPPHPNPLPPKAGGEGTKPEKAEEPLTLALSPQGRGEGTGEAKPKRAGRIRFLEDTDGDGQYDKTTLFLEGVPFPNGVIAWKKGVLVSAAPDIFYAEDTDGDGKADVKHVLFTGFAEGNQQHLANGFSRGLDNWLYLANGDSGGTVTCVQSLDRALAPAGPQPSTLDPQPKIDIRGRDIRIRPDTGEIEAVVGQSQFGRNRDDWGNWFGNNNSRPMYHYVLDDHYLRRNPHLAAPNPQQDVSVAPGAAPVFPTSRTLTRFNDFHTANRFTSACSSMVDRGELLVPSPPSSGERARVRVRGPNGEKSPDHETDSSKSPVENRQPVPAISPPHPNPLPPKAGGEGTGETFVFISEPVHNLVHREVMTADGLSFTSRRHADDEQSEFLSSTDNWFRPTQLKTGPDGALYVADMYRLVIEHPQWIPIEWQKKLDLRAGHDKGRIWRVSPVGSGCPKTTYPGESTFGRPAPKSPRPVLVRGGIPILTGLDNESLVAALDSPNGWQRDLVQQLLIDRMQTGSEPRLLRAQAIDSKNPLCRLHSLCTLDGYRLSYTPGDNTVPLLSSPAWGREQVYREIIYAIKQILPQLLADPHPGVRRHAVRICDMFGDGPEERKTARLLIGKLPDAIVHSLTKLVDDADPQVRLQLAYTLGEIRHSQADIALGRLAAKANGQAWMMAAVLSSLRADNLPTVMSEAIATAPDDTNLLQQLLTQAAAFKSDAAVVTLLMRVTEPSPAGSFARWQFSALEQFALAQERRGEPFNPLVKLREGVKVPERFMAMIVVAKRLASNEEADMAHRESAVRVIGLGDEVEVLQSLLVPQQPPALQSAAITALGRMKRPEVPKTLLAAYRSLAPSLRAEAASTLLSRDAWRDELLAALETKQLAPTELDAASRQRLLDHKSKDVRDRAVKLLAVDLNTDRAKLVAEYLPTVRGSGDVLLGRQLFTKRCAQCHKLGNEGHSVGPDLASLTDKSHEALLTAILDPNRAVEAKFLTFVAVTKTGVSHIGLIANESATSLTLRAAEAKETALLRNELDELQSTTKSLMPEGLEKEVTPADAAALIAYIRHNVPLPARKTFPGNEPTVVQPGADGSITLTPFTAEIYGPTIVIEESHKNLGWWSSADDSVVWTIQVPRAGRYSVAWLYACEASAAGNTIVVEAAGKSLRHKVAATSSWDDYKSADLGELELPAGEIRLTAKPASRPLPALADVKSVTLRKVPE